MKTQCILTFTYQNKAQAQAIAQALKIDDQNFIKTTTNDNTITAELQTDNIKSLIQTLDDYLACLDIASTIATSDKH